MEKQTSERFDCWCLVELFGHSKIAGRCTEQNIAGTNMLRVDVPETATQPGFTRFFGSSAIYAINPIDEETCKQMAEKIQVLPIDVWSAKAMLDKMKELPAVADPLSRQNEEEDDDYNF